MIEHPIDASTTLLSNLIKDLGLASAGFYWALVEHMTQNDGVISLDELKAFAESYGCDYSWACRVVSDYRLFPSAELLFMDKVMLPEAAKDPLKKEKKAARKVDFETVRTLFNSTCTSFTKVFAASETRRKKVTSRLVEMTQLGDPVEIIKTVFEKMEASDVLKGKNKAGWKATFDWLIDNGSNWVKVYEGNYDKSFTQTATDKDVNSYWDK